MSRSFNDLVGVPKDADDEIRDEIPVNMSCFTCGSDDVKVLLQDGSIKGTCPKGHVSVLPWTFGV